MSFFEKCKTSILVAALACASGSVLAESYSTPYYGTSWGEAFGTRNAAAGTVTGYITDRNGTNGNCVTLRNYSWTSDVAGTRTCIGNQWKGYTNAWIGGGIPCLYEEHSGRTQCFVWAR